MSMYEKKAKLNGNLDSNKMFSEDYSAFLAFGDIVFFCHVNNLQYTQLQYLQLQ